MLRELTLFGERDKVATAIERLRTFEPPEGYILAFSGGKDSQCAYHIAKASGVKFEAKYNVTGIDPPEVVRFIRQRYPEVKFNIPRPNIWRLIAKKGLPKRQTRWCCAKLKESKYPDRLVITGVRWAESARRAARHGVVTTYERSKLINPLIDWDDRDVWQFLRESGIESCSLYSEGFKRLGCVLCPFSSKREIEIKRWPGIVANYRRALAKYVAGPTPGAEKVRLQYATSDDFFDAWAKGGKLFEPTDGSVQCEMFGGAGNE